MLVHEETFAPIWEDVRRNAEASNAVLDLIIRGQVGVLPLFECDPALFAEVRDEAVALSDAHSGQALDSQHPTAKYVKANDPSWTVKPNTVHQYSLYNSHNDVLFNDEDHHWHTTARRFNSRLTAIPKFFHRYFGSSELQNFRMQSIRGGGDLGLHREKIVGIPKREQHYKLRFHLPIVTNPGVRFMMDGQSYTMKAGWVHIFNQACMHGVENKGDALRIHLVFDCYLNDSILQSLIGPAARA